jgi:hypothetical protein
MEALQELKDEGIRQLSVKEKNFIQAELIKRSGKDGIQWITDNSEKFDKIMRESVGLRRRAIENPMAVVDEVEELLV